MGGGPVDDERTSALCDQFADLLAGAASTEGPDDTTAEAINALGTVGHQDGVERGAILKRMPGDLDNESSAKDNDGDGGSDKGDDDNGNGKDEGEQEEDHGETGIEGEDDMILAPETPPNPTPSASSADHQLAKDDLQPKDETYDIVLQPKTRPISQEQLVAEVKGIYAGLVMVEAKCIEVTLKHTRENLPYYANVELIRFYKLVPEKEPETAIVLRYPPAGACLQCCLDAMTGTDQPQDEQQQASEDKKQNQLPATEDTQPPVDEKDPPPATKETASPAHDGDAADVSNNENATEIDPSPVDDNAQPAFADTDQPPRENGQHAVAAKARSPTKKPEPPKMKKVYGEERVLGREMFVDPITTEQHQALLALRRTLIHEHHDFFLASQHPSASNALKRLMMKYHMPSRLWRHGIHEFLEFNRHRLETEGGILQHMMATFFMDYNMLALLWETAVLIQEPSPVVVKSNTQMSPQELPHERRRREHEEYKNERDSVLNKLKRTFAECLGDISRYRLVTDDEDTRSAWVENSIHWYMKAHDDVPGTGRLLHHLAILSRPNTLSQMALFSSAIAAPRPFDDGRASMIEPLVRLMQQQSLKITEVEQAFAVTFGHLYSVAQNAESRSKLKCQLPSYESEQTRNELDVSIKHLADIMKHEDWLVSQNSTSEGVKRPADALEKPASVYEFVSTNAEQKTKDPPEKEHYVPTAEEAERKAREEEYKNSEEAAAFEKMRLNAAQEQKEPNLKLWEQRQSEVRKMVKVPSKWLNIAVVLCNMFLMTTPAGMDDPMRDALVPKPPMPEATSAAEKENESSGNGGESAEKQNANASPRDDKSATTETAVSTDQALKSESSESQEAVEISEQDRPKKDSPETPEQDDPKDSLEQGEAASIKPRKKKITVAEVHEDHINNQGWEEFADFRIIEVDDYDVQPEPEEAPEKKENNEQEKDISEKAVEIEKPTLTEAELEALHRAERAQCKYVFSKKLKLLRLVCTARFDHLLKERQEEAWDKGTLQFLHVILTFMRYVAAKGPVSNNFQNAFRADQIAEIATRILRFYQRGRWDYGGSGSDYWHKIHIHSFPRFDVKPEFPRQGDGLMNTPLPEDFFKRGFWWAQEAVASGDEVLFAGNLPNEGESPDDDEEVLLPEQEVEDKNSEEGESLTVNIEKAETLDDKAKEAQSPAPQNPDPQKQEWEPPNKGVEDGTLYPPGFFATHGLDLDRRDWEHQDVNDQRMVRIAWLVVWMASHDMWFSYDLKTCTITAKCLDEEEFVWEPQEFRMPGVEKAEDAEKSKETQEAPEAEATKPERTEETDFDVKSISTYTESFVELEAVGSEIGNDMGDRDTWSEAGDDEGPEARAARKGVLRVDALLAKNANEAKYDVVSEWAGKVAGKVSMAMDQRTARGPNEDGEEIAGDGGEDETVIGGEAQGGEANKSDSGSGSFQVSSV